MSNIRPGGGSGRGGTYRYVRGTIKYPASGYLSAARVRYVRTRARRRKVGVAFFSARFQEYCCKMAEFVTCSQDSVVFWDNKSFSSKKSSQPFSGSGYHVASASWSSSSIQNCYTIVYTLSVRIRGHSYLWMVVEYYIS